GFDWNDAFGIGKKYDSSVPLKFAETAFLLHPGAMVYFPEELQRRLRDKMNDFVDPKQKSRSLKYWHKTKLFDRGVSFHLVGDEMILQSECGHRGKDAQQLVTT
ncbi:unnamed protein product, partial [Amoebophrya sp. A25]